MNLARLEQIAQQSEAEQVSLTVAELRYLLDRCSRYDRVVQSLRALLNALRSNYPQRMDPVVAADSKTKELLSTTQPWRAIREAREVLDWIGDEVY